MVDSRDLFAKVQHLTLPVLDRPEVGKGPLEEMSSTISLQVRFLAECRLHHRLQRRIRPILFDPLSFTLYSARCDRAKYAAVRFMLKIRILAVVAVTITSGLLASGCGDETEPQPTPDVGDTASGSDAADTVSEADITVVDENAPTMPRLVAVFATAADELTVFWLPAQDNLTAPDSLVYEIHRGAGSDFTPGDATYLTEVVGAGSARVSDLNRGETQFVTVVARDGDGLISPADEPIVISLPDSDLMVKDGVNIVDLTSLGAPEVEDDTFAFQDFTAEDAPALSSGDFIAGHLEEGLFLRRVLSVTEGEGVLSVVTAAAAPTDVIDTGRIVGQVRFTALPVALEPSTTEGRDERSAVLADGTLVARDSRRQGSGESDGAFSFGRSEQDEVAWTGSFAFTPTLAIDVSMNPDTGIESADTNMTGVLAFNVQADFPASFSGLSNFQYTIYEQTASISYWLGPVPITQELTIEYRGLLESTVNQPFGGDFRLDLDADLDLDASFDGIGWAASGGSSVEYTFEPSLEQAGAVEAELVLLLDVSTVIDSVLYLTERTRPSLQTNIESSAVSDCPIDMELQRYDAEVSLSLAAGPSIEAPVDPRLSLPSWSEIAFSLPALQIAGPENAFRPGGARFRYGGEAGVGSAIDTTELSWSVTPETELTVDAGVATVVPDVATAEPKSYVLALAGHTDTLGPGGVLCAPTHTFTANNRQATCQEEQIFIIPGRETRFSVTCSDADRDYPVTVAVADGPFAGLLHEPIPQSVTCDDDLCTVEFLFSVTDPAPALTDLMVLLPTDSRGLVGSLAGSFGNVQLGFNRAPKADPMTIIADLNSSSTVSREAVLEIDDPTVAGDPNPGVITTELTAEPILGSAEKIDELTYRYIAAQFTTESYGSPLPDQNLYDRFEITATDAHGASSEPIEITAILRPPLCDEADLEPPGSPEDWSDYCVIEFCTAETCNVECLPLAALANPLEANVSRYPPGTTCAEKADRWGTNWGGEPSETTGDVIDVPCPCVADRDYADQVWLDFDAPAPYDTCDEWPFPWYTVCKAPPGWRD